MSSIKAPTHAYLGGISRSNSMGEFEFAYSPLESFFPTEIKKRASRNWRIGKLGDALL